MEVYRWGIDFHRISNCREPFSHSQRHLILRAIENVQAVLKERGLDPLPTEHYPYYGLIHEFGVDTSLNAVKP